MYTYTIVFHDGLIGQSSPSIWNITINDYGFVMVFFMFSGKYFMHIQSILTSNPIDRLSEWSTGKKGWQIEVHVLQNNLRYFE